MAENVQAIEPEEADGLQGAPARGLLQVAWERKALVALGLTAGVVVSALYYARSVPVYQASAQVLVIKKRPDALPIPGSDPRLSYLDDYLSTHLRLIASPLIIEKAAQ